MYTITGGVDFGRLIQEFVREKVGPMDFTNSETIYLSSNSENRFNNFSIRIDW